MRKVIRNIFTIIAAVLLCSPVSAHMLWLNAPDQSPGVGDTVEIGIGWGHSFKTDRIDQQLKEGQIEAVQAVDPQGVTVELERKAVDRYELKVEQAGAYIVTARMKPVSFTNTADGRKWGDKKSVAEAVKCTNFHMTAKTVVIAGGVADKRGAPGGLTLELIPLSDPTQLGKDRVFTAEIRYNGQPLAGARISAVYAGFDDQSAKGETSDKKARPGLHPVRVDSDAQGRVELPLERAGHWLVVLSHTTPYPDSATCDEYMFTSTYTFEVP